MYHIIEFTVAAVIGAYVFKYWGSKITASAVEAEFKKVESVATTDVKSLIAKVRSVL
jgi:hypothetical protein